MASEDHTKIINIPYPGRDLAILSLLLTFILPLVGPLIGFVAAKRSLAETYSRDYSQLGIQRFAYGASATLFLVEILILLGWLLITKGYLEWFSTLIPQ